MMEKQKSTRRKKISARTKRVKAIGIGPRVLHVRITEHPQPSRILNLRTTARTTSGQTHAATSRPLADVSRSRQRHLRGLLISVRSQAHQTSRIVKRSYHSAAVRGVSVFTLIALAVIVPFHALVAYQSLQDTKGAVLGAATNTGLTEQLQKVGEVVQDLNPFLKKVLLLTSPGREGLAVLEIGQDLARVAQELEAIEQTAALATPLEKLFGIRGAVARMTGHVARAEQNLVFVHGRVVPEELKPLVQEARERLPRLRHQLERLNRFLTVSPVLVGSERPQRYLAVFQNNHELRATGGFIGSFAIIEFDRGRFGLVNLPAYGSYALDYGLRTLEAPPAPLRSIVDRMTFHDANWDPDFPSSARNLLYWYEQSGGETLDGVIAINARLVQDVLAVVGPVEAAETGLIITADNFTKTAEAFAAARRGTKDPPKELLANLAPQILTRAVESLANIKQASGLLAVMADGLAHRDIQLYHTDRTIEAVFAELGYAGSLLPIGAHDDYVFPVFTNIGGWKTDQVMQTNLALTTAVDRAGTVDHTLVITRDHEGHPNGPEGTVQENKSYVRLYVPEGAILVSADGFEAPPPETKETVAMRVFKEHGRTVFAGWLVTPRGESRTANVVWRVPQLLDKATPYRLIVQKQAGLEKTKFTEQHETVHLQKKSLIIPTATADDGGAIPFTSDVVIQIKRNS